MSQTMPGTASVVPTPAPTKLRKVHDVPFVELFSQRLQGVVSSGSDINRVYVAFFEAGTGNYSCSTNNNRPCGGGGLCKHLQRLLSEAVEQFGVVRVAQYLEVPGDVTPQMGARDILAKLRGVPTRAQVSAVFSRFLGYLRYVELSPTAEPVPEMAWFVAG